MESRRVFSEKEVAEILQRAVVIAETQPANYTPGITLEEVERIAAEAGVPVSAVRQAIAERAGIAAKGSAETRLGAPIERVVEGELAAEDFDLVVEGLRPMRHGGHSQAAQVGKTLQVRVWHGGAPTAIQVTSRKGRTRLVVQAQVWLTAFFTLYPAFVFSVVAAGTLGEAGHGALAAAIMGVTMLAGAVVGLTLARRSQRKAVELAGKLTAKLDEHLQAAAEESAPAPRVETDADALRQRL